MTALRGRWQGNSTPWRRGKRSNQELLQALALTAGAVANIPKLTLIRSGNKGEHRTRSPIFCYEGNLLTALPPGSGARAGNSEPAKAISGLLRFGSFRIALHNVAQRSDTVVLTAEFYKRQAFFQFCRCGFVAVRKRLEDFIIVLDGLCVVARAVLHLGEIEVGIS